MMGVLGGEEKEGIKYVFEEIMNENSQKLKRETYIQAQEAQRVPNKMNPNKLTPRHIIIKMAKFKQKFLKAAREELKIIYK